MPLDHSHNLIEIQNLSYEPAGASILCDINFNIHQGDYLGIIGPNGGGKTTLIKLILGLLLPTSGQVKVNCPKSKIGYVAQKLSAFDPKFPLTIRDVVSLGKVPTLKLGQTLSSDHKRDIDWAIDQVGLSPIQSQLIGTLSGGQLQRVFIARALAQKPELIFLDEPTTGVDTASQAHFFQLLQKLNQYVGITLVLVSHDLEVITNQVTEIAVINHKLVSYKPNPLYAWTI